ncbi:unnamed protein product [Rotaria sp. Silwood1]|nr:unnamed protein product [Rotaria sp. Silwood1]CAF1682805.1 unnamed protein product [Rotaria sp. Silwood1]
MMYCCSSDMCRLIIEQHLKNDLFKRLDKKKEDFLNEFNYLETIRDINRQYDEIVLTNCIIDERTSLENKSQLNDLYDLVERLNECEYLFNSQYDLIENVNKINRKENSSRSCILSYKTISSIQSNINNSLSPINNLTPMFIQSLNKTNVSRKVFQSNTTDQLTVKFII